VITVAQAAPSMEYLGMSTRFKSRLKRPLIPAIQAKSFCRPEAMSTEMWG